MRVLLAQGAASLGQGLRDAAEATDIQPRADLPVLIGTVIGSLLSAVGILFFMLTLYGGFIWMTARGNEESVNKGKKTVIAAVVGLMIVVASYAVTNLVLRSPESTPAGEDGS